MNDQTQTLQSSLQNEFLSHIKQEKLSVTVYLICGIKLQGVVTGFDHFSLFLKRNGHSQLIYKHAISTIMPTDPVSLSFDEEG